MLLNLRGYAQEVIKDEQAVLKELGLKMITLSLSSHRLPARYLLVELIETIKAVELPVLIHCHSGIDRASTASAAAAIARGNIQYNKAKCRLMLRQDHGSGKSTKTEDTSWITLTSVMFLSSMRNTANKTIWTQTIGSGLNKG